MNKKVGLFLTALILSSFLISFISAIPDWSGEISSGLDTIATNAEPILKWVLGDVTDFGSSDISAGEALLVKLLFFIILLSILYFTVQQIPFFNANSAVVWIISIIVSILGIRFLTSAALINLIWLPSGAVGITLAAFFPLVIYFFFIESFHSQPFIRRAGWIFFMVMFFALAIIRWPDFSGSKWNYAWIYVITAVLALLSYVFDGTIQKYWHKARIQRAGAGAKAAQAALVQDDIDKAVEAFRKNPAGYTGRTASGSSKPQGRKAYEADLKEYNDTIATIMSS